jgi:hypothetical protein
MSPPGHKYTSNASRALASLVFNHTRRRALEDLLRELEGWKPQETDGALAQRRIEELDKVSLILRLCFTVTNLGRHCFPLKLGARSG